MEVIPLTVRASFICIHNELCVALESLTCNQRCDFALAFFFCSYFAILLLFQPGVDKCVSQSCKAYF